MRRPVSRRRLLRRVGVASVAAVAGCASSDDERNGPAATAERTGEAPDGTPTDPPCRRAVHAVLDDPSPDTPEHVPGATVEATLVEEDGDRHYVLGGVERADVEAAFDRAGETVLATAAVEWCSQPVCDARTYLLLRSDADVERMRADFPDGAAVLAGETASHAVRLVYSGESDVGSLSDRARAADYETATAIGGTIVDCEVATPSPAPD